MIETVSVPAQEAATLIAHQSSPAAADGIGKSALFRIAAELQAVLDP